MRVRLLKPVASPWGTAPAGTHLDVPDDVGPAWIRDGAAAAIAPSEPPKEVPPVQETTQAQPAPENAAKPQPRPRREPRERRG